MLRRFDPTSPVTAECRAGLAHDARKNVTWAAGTTKTSNARSKAATRSSCALCGTIPFTIPFTPLTFLLLRDIFSSQDCSAKAVVRLSQESSPPLTELLARWQAGDEASLRRLLPAVYDELRRLAHYHLRKERPNHTLQSTALVHEAYLRLMKVYPTRFENREQFFALAAHLMRRILVDCARQRNAAKRYGGFAIELNEAIAFKKARSVDLLALDHALEGLSQMDPQQCRIVELRFFAGLSIEETSRALGISPATVKRDWATARIWLHKKMSGLEEHDA